MNKRQAKKMKRKFFRKKYTSLCLTKVYITLLDKQPALTRRNIRKYWNKKPSYYALLRLSHTNIGTPYFQSPPIMTLRDNRKDVGCKVHFVKHTTAKSEEHCFGSVYTGLLKDFLDLEKKRGKNHEQKAG
jgi:hypothetical protein